MLNVSPALRHVLEHPLRFSWQVICAFRSNQGMLLASALAYYALLSLIPLLVLVLMIMAQVYDSEALIGTVNDYLAELLPGREAAIIGQIRGFIDNPELAGWAGIISLLFFSGFAFRTMQTSLSVILNCEEEDRSRHLLLMVLIPYSYVLVLALALVLLTMLNGVSEAMQHFANFHLFGVELGLDHRGLIRLVTITCEFLLLTSFYFIMPVCRPRLRHAVVGGLAAMGMWEAARAVLFWYLSTWSKVNILYGTFATAIIILLYMEIMAIIILVGAQVMAEYRRIGNAKSTTGTTAAG